MTREESAWLPAAKGLAIAFVAALGCVEIHAPLPWMIGPLVAVAASRSAGMDCRAPAGARQCGQWIIGTALGLYFTPDVAQLVLRIGWSLLVAALFELALGYFCGYMLARTAGIDRTTAVFASVPGGAAEMTVPGERYGARVDEVAAAQSLRSILVVIVIPWIFAELQLHGADVFRLAESRRCRLQRKCSSRPARDRVSPHARRGAPDLHGARIRLAAPAASHGAVTGFAAQWPDRFVLRPYAAREPC
jgi:membrane AbrB-like protein